MNIAQHPERIQAAAGAHTFILYSADTLLAERLDQALASLGVVIGRAGNVEDLIREVGLLGPDAVFLVLDNTAHGASHQAARQLAEIYPTLARIGVGHPGEAALHAALQAGVAEFVDMDNLESATTIVSETLRTHDEQPRRGGGPMIALIGAKQGVGTSSISTQLALRIKAHLGEQEILLMDCGGPVRDCSLYLGLEPELNMLGAILNIARFDQVMLKTAFARHEHGLAVLPLPISALDRADIAATDALRLFRILRSHFGTVVVDLGGSPDPLLAQHLIRNADLVLLVCEQGISSLKASLDYLSQLETTGIKTTAWHAVINRHVDERAVSASHIGQRLGIPVLATLPHDASGLNDAQSLGQLLPAKNHWARAVDALALKVLEAIDIKVPATTEDTLGRRLSRLFVRSDAV
ncbi:hypothetical protein JHS3_28450 [Jeongeupia sp. HS-3]|uniref:AAA family ATPase n=1 Tax=Jeongeupia sp. HS-3 TaxID=1009682 RepID=UPI0018A3AD77|nr:hypothetical protein [Jeongeupia sp. HS-3]BCL77109.1 hypothetical protein JHS3_28450 [Jeongeupia sp. HS-3]